MAAIILETVYLGHAGQALRDAGEVVDNDLLAHIAPLVGWEHLNLTGDYLWSEMHGNPSTWKAFRQKIDLLEAA